jgi:hypothetical protein
VIGIVLPIRGRHADPCFASTVTRDFPMTNVLTRRTWPCDFHTGQKRSLPLLLPAFEPGGCFAACGLWHPEPETLLKVRNAMMARPKEWRVVRKLLSWPAFTDSLNFSTLG